MIVFVGGNESLFRVSEAVSHDSLVTVTGQRSRLGPQCDLMMSQNEASKHGEAPTRVSPKLRILCVFEAGVATAGVVVVLVVPHPGFKY